MFLPLQNGLIICRDVSPCLFLANSVLGRFLALESLVLVLVI